MTFVTDPFTGKLRLVAPERAQRLDLIQHGCPFCIGNEHLTTAESWRSTDPETGEWMARSFPNMFPLVPATHDVLVPTSRHATSLRDLTDKEWLQLAELWIVAHARLTLSLRDDESVLIYCNDGPAAGASLEHVHAHAAVVPAAALTDRITRVSVTDICPACTLSTDSDLVIAKVGSCIVAAHPAPITSQGLIVTSTNHESSLPPVTDLAEILAAAVKATPPEADLNLWLISDFLSSGHWYIELAPRIGYLAAMELALGTGVTVVEPPNAAQLARVRLQSQQP
ncbi:MAG: HIT domain-containing protein [Thermoleophilia bacterium]|nr:HIT domain-containing protein [Thermoleophilia bacterium]